MKIHLVVLQLYVALARIKRNNVAIKFTILNFNQLLPKQLLSFTLVSLKCEGSCSSGTNEIFKKKNYILHLCIFFRQEIKSLD